MNATQLVTVVESAVCLVLLISLLLDLMPAFREDAFRQQMFALRDEMFDYAASGAIAFNDPAYRLLRQSMNGFLRFAHRLTLLRLCLTIVKWRMSSEAPELKWHTRWQAAMETVPDETSAKLKDFHSRALGLVVKRLVTGSPLLICILLVLFCGALVKEGIKNLNQMLREAAFLAVSRVLDPRVLEEEAARLAG